MTYLIVAGSCQLYVSPLSGREVCAGVRATTILSPCIPSNPGFFLAWTYTLCQRMEEAVKQLDPLGSLRRTHYCGTLRPGHVGQEAVLCGWVHRRRDHGGV